MIVATHSFPVTRLMSITDSVGLLEFADSLIPSYLKHQQLLVNNQRYIVANHFRQTTSIGYDKCRSICNAVLESNMIAGFANAVYDVSDLLSNCNVEKVLLLALLRDYKDELLECTNKDLDVSYENNTFPWLVEDVKLLIGADNLQTTQTDLNHAVSLLLSGCDFLALDEFEQKFVKTKYVQQMRMHRNATRAKIREEVSLGVAQRAGQQKQSLAEWKKGVKLNVHK